MTYNQEISEDEVHELEGETCVLCGELYPLNWGRNPDPLHSADDGKLCCERCDGHVLNTRMKITGVMEEEVLRTIIEEGIEKCKSGGWAPVALQIKGAVDEFLKRNPFLLARK